MLAVDLKMDFVLATSGLPICFAPVPRVLYRGYLLDMDTPPIESGKQASEYPIIDYNDYVVKPKFKKRQKL